MVQRGHLAIVTHLKNLELFSQLNEEELEALAEIVHSDRISKGNPIVHQGEIKPVLYIIVEGEAVARSVDEEGQERPVRYFRAGDAFGETSLLVGEPRDATVIATSDVEVLHISKPDFERFLAQHPRVRRKLKTSPRVKAILEASQYDWLVEGEAVIWHGHRHWYVLVISLLPYVLAIVAMLLMGLFAKGLIPLLALPVLLVLIWIGILVMNWKRDRFIVTNRRVVYTEIYPYQLVPSRQAPLEQIQDIRVDIPFPLGMFKAGNIVISTAGRLPGQIVFDRVPNPEKIREIILSQKARLLRWERAEERSRIRERMQGEFRPMPSIRTAPMPTTPRPRIRWLATEIREGNRTIWRTHYFILIKRILTPSLVLAVLVALSILALLTKKQPLCIPLALLVFIAGMWFLSVAMDWANEQYIVTPQQVMAIRISPVLPFIPPLGMFRRVRVRVAPLSSIQDITARLGYLETEQGGPSGGRPSPQPQKRTPTAALQGIYRALRNQLVTLTYLLLGIGHVVLETAAPAGRMVFKDIGNPFRVQNVLFEYIFNFSRMQRWEIRRDVERLIEDWIWVHKELDHTKESGPPFFTQ